jgi:hypothetical protein
VEVFRLLSAGTVEEQMYWRQVYKQQLMRLAVDNVRTTRRITDAELYGLERFFRRRKTGVQGKAGVEGKAAGKSGESGRMKSERAGSGGESDKGSLSFGSGNEGGNTEKKDDIDHEQNSTGDGIFGKGEENAPGNKTNNILIFDDDRGDILSDEDADAEGVAGVIGASAGDCLHPDAADADGRRKHDHGIPNARTAAPVGVDSIFKGKLTKKLVLIVSLL